MSYRLYGREWPEELDRARVEMLFIQGGGYVEYKGERTGEGLFHHYKALQGLLWPELDHHRWTDLILRWVLGEDILCVVGARDTGKTHCAARFTLADYFCFPENTLAVMSSTSGVGLQLRVWGEVKDLLWRAKEKRPWLAGNCVESKTGIFTDALDDKGDIRDMRKGIVCVGCSRGDESSVAALANYCGLKQKRRRLIGDEVQFMPGGYLNVLANLESGDFKGVFLGNPLGNGDPLDRLSEPEGGWANFGEPTKTTVYQNRRGGRTINLVGTDSPNFDFPSDQPKRYRYLIGHRDVELVRRRYGVDSIQYYSQILGVRRAALYAHRVLTWDECVKLGANAPCVWSGSGTTKIYALDAAFSGDEGDRPVGGMIEFGEEVGGRQVLKVHPPRELKISLNAPESPEEQLALAMRADCEAAGVPPENVFYDAGMRATLAKWVGERFSNACTPVNFGGPATPRPVSADEYVWDEKLQERRLKRCDEHYSKFVTELWFSVRLCAECRQMREFPEEVAREFEMREWTKVWGDRFELESKRETKKRMGQSPDLADWLAIGVEGARRLGFQIERLPNAAETRQEKDDWLEREVAAHRKFQEKTQLKY